MYKYNGKLVILPHEAMILLHMIKSILPHEAK